MRLIATVLLSSLLSLPALAAPAPAPYDLAVRNLKQLLNEQFRIDPTQMREIDSLRRDWLMDLNYFQLLTDYEHRFRGPEAKRVIRVLKATCNNDTVRCLAQSIVGAGNAK